MTAPSAAQSTPNEMPIEIDSLTKDALRIVLAAASSWCCTPMEAAARLLNELLKSSDAAPASQAALSAN